MGKVVVSIYHTYGKGDGEELSDRYIINNTKEEREGIFETFGYDEAVDNKKDFINGKIDQFSFDKFGGDWDEPTGGYILIDTKEELVSQAENNYKKELAKIDELFSR
jgi:hypothetical protein